MDKIIYSEKLNSQDLAAMLNDDIIGLVVRNYISPEICLKVGQDIATSNELEKYYYEMSDKGERKSVFLGVSRLGVSFSTTFGRDRNGPETKRYYDVANKNIEKIRNFFTPYLSPIDQLRLNLDELYEYGANLGNFENKKMFTGIARVTEKDMDLQEKNPHVDSLPPEYEMDRQYSANIYISVPQEGGELIIYPHKPLSAAEVDDFETNQILWENKLTDGIRIKPNLGDLIIINTRRPHAVTSFSSGSRVSLQSFIGLNKNHPLKLWC